MRPSIALHALTILVLCLNHLCTALLGAGPEADAGPATHEVTEGPFAVHVELEGVFESRAMAEVNLRTAAWSQFPVLEAVEAGTRVRTGDRLVTLDMKDLDRAIEDLEDSLEQGEIAVKQSEEELAFLEASLPLDLEAARRGMESADEDFLRFVKVDREASERAGRDSLLSSENYLEYQLEEFRQLEKMYKADDLTEETEEIVLRRQRDAVDSARRSVLRAKRLLARTLEVTLPRREKDLKSKARRETLTWAKTEKTLPLTVKLKRLGLEKTHAGHRVSRERLAKLIEDRKAMQIRSPADGVVYYGRCVDGKWLGGALAAGKLRRGGQLQQHEVFMTIVDTDALFVRASVPEAQLHRLHSGLKGRVVPTGFPRSSLGAVLDRVSTTPKPAGGFDARVTLGKGGKEVSVAPGMTCKIRILSYGKTKAISVPASALFTDPLSEEDSFVYFVVGDNVAKRKVTPGERVEKRVEILEGLSAGDVIRLEPPE